MDWRGNSREEMTLLVSLGGSITKHLNKALKWSQKSSVSGFGDYLLSVYIEKKSLRLCNCQSQGGNYQV